MIVFIISYIYIFGTLFVILRSIYSYFILFHLIFHCRINHEYDNEYSRSILFVHAKEITALKRLAWTTVRISLIKPGNENIPRWFIITSLFLHTKNIGLQGIWWNTLTIVRIKVQKIEWVTTLNNHILCFRVFSLIAFTDAQDWCESLLSFSVRKINKCRNFVAVLYLYISSNLHNILSNIH